MERFRALIGKVATGAQLTREEATHAFDKMMSGEATPAQMGGFLRGMRIRGESVDEITGAVATMRAKMLKVEAPLDAIDVVGTGGDAAGSYNISTCAAFIVAGARGKSPSRARRDFPLHQGSRHRLHVRAGASSGDEACRSHPRRTRHPHDL